MISLLAHALEPHVGIERAYLAAWVVIIVVAALLAGTIYLIIDGG